MSSSHTAAFWKAIDRARREKWEHVLDKRKRTRRKKRGTRA